MARKKQPSLPIKLSFIFASLLFVPTTQAQSKEAIAKCAAISGSVERLSCFDSIAKTLGVDSPGISTVASEGKWQVQVQQSPLDDSTNVSMILDSESAISARFGRTETPQLILRCKENKTEAYINFETYLGNESAEITTRLDKDKAQRASWSVSTSNSSAFAPRPLQFIKSLMKKDSLLVGVTPYGENPVMTSFDLRGLSKSIEPLQKACGWN